jgi:TolB-like protein/Flp pilus assembly protein TadD
VVVLYTVAAWAVIQVGDLAIDAGLLVGLTLRNLFVLTLTGFPLVMIAGWFYDITRHGVVRTAPEGSDESFKESLQLKDYLLLFVLVVLWSGAYVYVHTPPSVEKSIAVLPFENRGNDPENANFALGIHDDLMTQLQRIGDLKLIAGSSVSKTDLDAPVETTGQRLGATYIMKGTVERVLDRIRVSVVLIVAAEAQQAWAGSFDRELSAVNLFSIRDEITSAITENLQAVLSPAEQALVFDLPTESMKAYRLYSRGRQLLSTRRTKDIQQALQAFNLAVEIDPDFALGWVGVADTNFLLSLKGIAGAWENFEPAIDKALALNDQLGEAWVSLGMLYNETEKPEEAEAAYLKAIELSPNYAQAYHWYTTLFHRTEYLEKNLALMQKAAQLDPLSSIISINIADGLDQLGRYDEALDQYYQQLELVPDYHLTYRMLGKLLIDYGHVAEGILVFRKLLELEPDNAWHYTFLAGSYLHLGDYETVTSMRYNRNQKFGTTDIPLLVLDFRTLSAQGRVGDLPALLDGIPPEIAEMPFVFGWNAIVQLFVGDLQAARENLLKLEPGWSNPDQWQDLIKNSKEFACNYAGMLMGTGDEALGKDLLQQIIYYHEEILPGLIEDSHRRYELAWCYLLEGSHEKAFEFIEQRIEHGHIWSSSRGGAAWVEIKQMPWWDPLRDHPRYFAIEKRVEEKMAEQRELLRQMDEAGTTVP